MYKRFCLVLTSILLFLGLAVPAQAATASPSPLPCHINSNLVLVGTAAYTGDDIEVTTTGDCSTTPVSLTVWKATSLSGVPLTAQTRGAVLQDGILLGSDNWFQVGDLPCPFYQIDLAYGAAPADLTTPYGKRLIAAWHGAVECITPTPTPSETIPVPVPSTPAPSSPPVTTPPASSPPVTTPAPVPSTPAPTTSVAVVPSPTLPVVPPVVVTTKPTPVSTNPGGGFGCVGDSCPTTPAPHKTVKPSVKPTPAPTTVAPAKPQLPFTGAPTGLLVTLGLVLLFLGVSAVVFTRKRGRA